MSATTSVSPLRTYGRIYDQPPTLAYPNGAPRWVEVTTDANGYNDMVYLTTMAQVLKLNLGESPFYADWGIPARASVMQQIAPDYNVILTQQRFAPFFASLTVTKTNNNPPTYQINAITKQGAILTFSTIPV